MKQNKWKVVRKARENNSRNNEKNYTNENNDLRIEI